MTDWDALAAELARRAPGARVERDLTIGALTTYRVGGAARLFVAVPTPAALGEVAPALADTVADDLAVVVVGRGSNLLVADHGFEGVAVQLGDGFAEVAIDHTRCLAGAAASLPVVARQTVAAGLTGFEWAVGVPGSVGGAVRMNAGGHGSDMAASLVGASVWDLRAGELRYATVAELGLGYRCSSVAPHEVVVSAELALAPGDPEQGQAELADIVRWRREHQPGGHNAGSVFTNPPGDSAGRLIDAAGCKGLRIGSAEVSVKHANFIQADEGGSAGDVAALMAEVQRRVVQVSGVTLVPETHLVGFGPLDLVTGEEGQE